MSPVFFSLSTDRGHNSAQMMCDEPIYPSAHRCQSAVSSQVQSIAANWYLFNQPSPNTQSIYARNRATSILVILLGTMYYTWVKSQESAQPPRPSPSAPREDLESGLQKDIPNVQVVDLQEKKEGTN